MGLEEMATLSLHASSLGKQVYEVLRDQILMGALKPGQRLAVPKLAKQLGVSVTPVRDALQRLSGDGLIEIIPRRGTFVSRCTTDDVREVFQVRDVVECAAVERVTEAAADLLEEMEKTVREMSRIYSLEEDERTRQYRRYVAWDAVFHACIVRMLGNERITQFYEQLRWPGQILLGLSYANYERATETIVEHAAILEALKQGDISEAKAAIRYHLSGAEDELLDHVSRNS